MREALLALVLVTATLAGCIGDDAPVDATDAASESGSDASIPTFPNGTKAPDSLHFSDCYEHFAYFPVPQSAYEDRLPDGFSLDSSPGDPSGETATLIVLAQECQISDGSTNSRATVYLPVDPPDAWEHPDEDAGHDLVLSVTTDAERVAAVLGAWGLADIAAAGEVTLEDTQAPTVRTGTFEARAGDATLSMETTVQGTPEELDGGLTRQFAVGDDGTVTGARDLDWTAWQGIFGSATVSGSYEAGMPETEPVPPGSAGHAWGFEQKQTYVDLPPREGS